jgi:ATP-dependent 26S proteasome regulatory subunit
VHVSPVDILDPAILRRLDRQIHVGYPDRYGRRDIFKVHARRIRCNVADIDWDYLASDDMTADLVGADIRNIVNDAALLAVRDQSDKVFQHHLEKAVARAQEMKGTLQSSNNSSSNKHNNALRHGNPFLHSPLFGN